MVRWLHTARHLPPRQIAAWALARLKPSAAIAIISEPSGKRSPHFGALADEAVRLETDRVDDATARGVLEYRFCFLSLERRLTEIDWSVEYVSPLWTYHLHYFDYAVDLATAWRSTDDERYVERYLELWNEWLDAASKGEARIEPYPTSVRCMNALRSLWLLHGRVPEDFADRLLRAIHAQLDWLDGNLERHLRANHLQKNLTALAWGSLAFGGERAAGWRSCRDELWTELREQVLPDGGHFERSPMYHAAALDDFLRTLALCHAAGVRVPNDIRVRLAAMTRALQWLSRADGTLHLFNDAANAAQPSAREVVGLARQVLREDFPEPSGVFALRDTGYYGTVDPAAGRRLVIDAGPLGPSYQPGHAHCDMLSFELDFAGQPVVVDSGVHGYDGDPYREYVRSTRAHNTVAIDGREQHEMWATFRVAGRGEIVRADCRETTEGFLFEGVCRPYHRRRAVHRRAIVLRGDELTVIDKVEGAEGCLLTSWLHLHPDLRLKRADSGFVAVTHGPSAPLRVSIEVFGTNEVVVRRGERDPVQGWYCPEFGMAMDAAALELCVVARVGLEFGYRIRRITS